MEKVIVIKLGKLPKEENVIIHFEVAPKGSVKLEDYINSENSSVRFLKEPDERTVKFYLNLPRDMKEDYLIILCDPAKKLPVLEPLKIKK